MVNRLGFLFLAGILAGCSGGGVEVPGPANSPIQIFLIANPKEGSGSTQVVGARQWRLWGVGSQTSDSTRLESRGILTDSAGVITLPPDSGTFLVEAWMNSSDHTPPDSLDVQVQVANSSLPDPTKCLTTISNQSAPNRVPGCTEGISHSPSTQAGSGPLQAPDIVTMVTIPGIPIHKFRMLGRVTGDTLVMGESRLWLMNDSGMFRGVLKQGSLTSSDFPTLSPRDSFVVEAWIRPGDAPRRIATKVKSLVMSKAFESCVERIGDPLPNPVILHACPTIAPNFSGGLIPPDLWDAVIYMP